MFEIFCINCRTNDVQIVCTPINLLKMQDAREMEAAERRASLVNDAEKEQPSPIEGAESCCCCCSKSGLHEHKRHPHRLDESAYNG